jgi:ribosomal protein L7Ae-like RNA K-turn-binding protein
MLDIFSAAELSHAIGSDRKVIAVQDKGFAKKMESLMK